MASNAFTIAQAPRYPRSNLIFKNLKILTHVILFNHKYSCRNNMLFDSIVLFSKRQQFTMAKYDFISFFNMRHQNVWLYNILLIFQATFISFMFQYLLSTYINCKPIIIGGLVWLAAIYLYEIFAHGIFQYNEKTNTMMLILFVIYSLLFYYHLIKDDEYINLVRLASFWWVGGLFLFYFGSTAANIFIDNLSPQKGLELKFLSSFIFKMLNVLLYGCWSYSFICRKWLTKASSNK